MSTYTTAKAVLEQIYPLHRTLVSDGLDRSLEIVAENLPEAVEYQIENYLPGQKAWTWTIPERYVVHHAYLELENGEKVLDFSDNPLHLLSYSFPVDSVLTWDELAPHLYFSEKRPDAIPWQFKFYERNWGFCLAKSVYDRLPRDRKYHVVIDVEFVIDPQDGFRIGTGVIHPQGGKAESAGELILCTHICHPNQANDDAAGVATAIELAHRLARNPLPAGSMSIRFLFCPETIGTIAYLSHNEDLIPNLKGGIFIEMTGNDNNIILQHSRQGDGLMDRVAQFVLMKAGRDFREGEFAQVVANDERVINGPGVNVPCISISRWPYDEYHTSDDNPSIIFEDKLQEAADLIEQMVRIYATNYIPKRKFRGPVFLSGYGLWIDWRVNRPLNRATEKIMMMFEGQASVFEIAEAVGMDYDEVRAYIERFRANDLVTALPMPSVAEEE
jgi:aminopeptidase-like protein